MYVINKELEMHSHCVCVCDKVQFYSFVVMCAIEILRWVRVSTCHGGSKGTSRGLPSQPNMPYTGHCDKPQVLCARGNTNKALSSFSPPEWLRIRQFFSAGQAKVT
jgi:hypothetical protein